MIVFADILGQRCLLTSKTTYKLDLDYLSLPIIVLCDGNSRKIDALYVLWLPKRKAEDSLKLTVF